MITHAHTVTVDISSLEVLAQMASRCQVDAADFQKSIGAGRYRKQLEEGNQYAWETNGLDAVPSYRSGKHFIGSKDGFLVPEKQLAYFLDGLME
ncbi:hypothetical protein ACG0Z4_10385 [Enterocloster aldenensis]|uniref:hypothetical protein n=1 Tax=Enterocloster aldenensis TaxID=358742 RepID=UPI00402622A7